MYNYAFGLICQNKMDSEGIFIYIDKRRHTRTHNRNYSAILATLQMSRMGYRYFKLRAVAIFKAKGENPKSIFNLIKTKTKHLYSNDIS